MQKQWFTEEFEIEKGRCLTIEVKSLLESRQSQFQKIDMYDTVPFGKMLVLDGVIQLTEFDNFAYHEMIAHVPLNAHPNPRKVLIVGGGDGGAVFEVLRHQQVEEVVLCDIDQEVVKISQKYFPEFAKALADKRCKVVIDDAAKYVASKENYFDVICVDSSDPIGPAEVLFAREFYENVYRALTVEGIVVSQSEGMFYHQDFIVNLVAQNKKIFPYVAYYYTLIPTYPSGSIGFSFCSKKYTHIDKLDIKKISALRNLKYYNLDIHIAAFVLPQFMQEALQGS